VLFRLCSKLKHSHVITLLCRTQVTFLVESNHVCGLNLCQRAPFPRSITLFEFFCSAGEYAGFDEEEPTCRSGGKGEVVRYLKETMDYTTVVLIGDGATDLEACPPADAFIGEYTTIILLCMPSKSNILVSIFYLILLKGGQAAQAD
jgi:hypothetical protein